MSSYRFHHVKLPDENIARYDMIYNICSACSHYSDYSKRKSLDSIVRAAFLKIESRFLFKNHLCLDIWYIYQIIFGMPDVTNYQFYFFQSEQHAIDSIDITSIRLLHSS